MQHVAVGRLLGDFLLAVDHDLMVGNALIELKLQDAEMTKLVA